MGFITFHFWQVPHYSDAALPRTTLGEPLSHTMIYSQQAAHTTSTYVLTFSSHVIPVSEVLLSLIKKSRETQCYDLHKMTQLINDKS